MRVFFALLISVSGLAQSVQPDSVSKSKKKVTYFATLQTASLIGCNDCSKGKEVTFSGAIVSGVRIKAFGVGVGVGHDSYRDANTAPIFMVTSWDIIRRKNALVLQVQYGTSLKTWRYFPYDYEEYGYKSTAGGTMFNPVMGYRLQYEKVQITFGVGYKYQVITNRYEYPTWRWTGTEYVPGDPSRRNVLMELSRLVVSMAVGWN
ncbi:MAG: hypothetical protein KF763_12175 [Cyclobacteriaceae bacterium]|nr:hypothetical protein [Cyclobacteriaceae bacterium]